jgi:hypothetical protein
MIEYAETAIGRAEESMTRSDINLTLIASRQASPQRSASFVAERSIRKLILQRLEMLGSMRARALLLLSFGPV